MSFGLALSGGGTRCAAHVGVLLALEEYQMLPASIAGTSGGGIVAGMYAAGISPQGMKELVEVLSITGFHLIDADYKGMLRAMVEFLRRRPVQFSGLIKGSRMERYFCRHTDNKGMEDAVLRTIITAVDLWSGQTIAYTNTLGGVSPVRNVEWRTDVKLCQAMRATSAVPAVFQPAKFGGMCLVDGGVTNILPVDLLIAAGEPTVLAVDVSKAYSMPDCSSIIEIASHSLSLMSSRLRDYVTSGEKLLMRPSLPEESGLLTFQWMRACMEAGYEATKKLMPTIQKLVA